MKIKMIAALLILSISPLAQAGDLSQLKSWPVWLAAAQCHKATFHCATEFQVHGDAAHKARSSCHNSAKAVDIFGSTGCLVAWSACLSGLLPTNIINPVLYCYAYGGAIGTGLYLTNSKKCNRAAHSDHIHLQPMFGCSNSGRAQED